MDAAGTEFGRHKAIPDQTAAHRTDLVSEHFPGGHDVLFLQNIAHMGHGLTPSAFARPGLDLDRLSRRLSLLRLPARCLNSRGSSPSVRADGATPDHRIRDELGGGRDSKPRMRALRYRRAGVTGIAESD